MSTEGINVKRRRILTTAASVVGGAGAVATAIPFISTLTPSAKTRAIGAPVEVDIGDLQPGQLKIAQWQGKPVWILRRSQESLDALATIDESELRDPNSEVGQQPSYAQNEYRSIKPEILIVLGLCTHLGCSPTFIPREGGASHNLVDWKGGFFCPCHGSMFDMSGRVFSGVPAPSNLVVPPHIFLSETKVLIGDDLGALS